MKNVRIIIAVLILGAVFSIVYFNNELDPGEPGKMLSEEDALLKEVNTITAGMTLEEKVWQLFFVAPEALEGGSTAEQPVGGIVYFTDDFKDRQQTIDMITAAQAGSEIPLFIGVDEEGGRVARAGSVPELGTTLLPPMQEIGETGNTNEAYNAGVTLGTDLSELGFNVDFAPVADVLINKHNTEIGDRAFGKEPELVADMTASLVKGMESTGVSSVLKHFPGHGSVKTNSHNGYAESTRTYEELKECEFIPFEAGIDAGSDFVMVSHMTLTAATDEKVPSSVSAEVVSGFLRSDLKFEGVIITDAFNMGAITDEYTSGQAAVKTLNAGVDMILMPEDLDEAYNAILTAVQNGTIAEERINKSVRRILFVKIQKEIIK